jgi:hypothetical protein
LNSVLDAGALAKGANTLTNPQHIVTQGDISFAGPDVSVSSSARAGQSSSGTTVQTIYVGKQVYVHTDGSSWQQIAYNQPFEYLGSVNPTSLSDATGPVTRLGATTIGGVAVTGYQLTVPASSQHVSLSGGTSEVVNVAKAPLSVWLDSKGRIVRTRLTQYASVVGKSVTSVSVTTTTLSKFGKPVSITAPVVGSSASG